MSAALVEAHDITARALRPLSRQQLPIMRNVRSKERVIIVYVSRNFFAAPFIPTKYSKLKRYDFSIFSKKDIDQLLEIWYLI